MWYVVLFFKKGAKFLVFVAKDQTCWGGLDFSKAYRGKME